MIVSNVHEKSRFRNEDRNGKVKVGDIREEDGFIDTSGRISANENIIESQTMKSPRRMFSNRLVRLSIGVSSTNDPKDNESVSNSEDNKSQFDSNVPSPLRERGLSTISNTSENQLAGRLSVRGHYSVSQSPLRRSIRKDSIMRGTNSSISSASKYRPGFFNRQISQESANRYNNVVRN